jgi:hypothetical protein
MSGNFILSLTSSELEVVAQHPRNSKTKETGMIHAILIGAGATALLDGWSAARAWLSGAPAPDYGLVGRWIAYFPRGRFFHETIAKSATVRGERVIGWIAHYAIGIFFAAVLIAVWGNEWVRAPALIPALIVGIGSVAAPFLIMQPGMGAGIAASRTPDPRAARLRSITTHAVFGLGLYAAGWAARLLEF